MANYQVYINVDGGAWFPSGSDPVANTGGMDLSVMEGDTMYPTLQGSGDVELTANFGATAFANAVPDGYTAGWPAAGGGFTALDPAKAYGSAALSGGNLVATFNTVEGMVQAADGQTAGKFYFEIAYTAGDIFNNSAGGGVGKNYAAGGGFNFWFSGAFNSDDNNGGGLLRGGDFNLFLGSLFALGNEIQSNVFTYRPPSVLGVAVFLTSGAPTPPPIPAQSVPNSLYRWRGQVGLNWLGMALVGDAFANVVGLSDFNNFTEYGNTMRFLVTTPPVQDDRKRIFVPRFELEVQCGDGLPDDPTAGPQMMLDWSKDGGVTWSTLQLWRSMGAAGDYTQRLRWLNMGQARQWIFRLQCTDVVRRYIIGAYIDDYRGKG